MNKQEAILAMQAGQKVTHRFFSSDEWISMKDGRVITEEGYSHDFNEFWFFRTGDNWLDGYSLYTA